MNSQWTFFTWKRVGLILAGMIGGDLGVFGMDTQKPSNQSVLPTLMILKEVQIALKCYQIEYDRWPVPKGARDYVAVLRGDVVKCLHGEPSELNPRGVHFIALPMIKEGNTRGGQMKDGTGEVWIVDQWSRPVFVMIDANGDNRLIPPDAKAEGSGELPWSVAVFSAGPDGIPGNEDDVTTWRG